jgi:hypothetical protein
MQIVKLKLAELAPNTGQIPGLPINPRQWTKGDVDKIAASLKETPELFEARPVLVIPHDGKYVILGGNLRYEGARANKEKEVPAIIFPEDTPVEKLKEVVIKDNGAFGAWDYDALANKWDEKKLGDWGMDVWQTPPMAFQPMTAAQNVPGQAPRQDNPPSASDDDGAGQPIHGMDNLPPELAGQDLTPDDLPKIEGDDKTATERIIIVYKPDQKETLEGIIGIGIDKVVYRLDEILNPTKKEEEKAAEE